MYGTNGYRVEIDETLLIGHNRKDEEGRSAYF